MSPPTDRSSPYLAVLLDVSRGGPTLELGERSTAALERWRRGGLALAAFSTSGGHELLGRAGLADYLDAVVAGDAEKAALGLGIDPADALVLNSAELSDLGGVRFPRRLPNLLERRRELVERRGGRRLALFLDFDGTLAPIVDDPDDAALSDPMRAAVETAAERFPVALVSGRDRPDVRARVGLDHLFYAGSHGFDIAGPGRAHTLPEAESAVADIERLQPGLREAIGHIDGVVLERKRFSLAVHYRMVDEGSVERVVAAVDDALSRSRRLRLHEGKKVLELQPELDWHKGRAVRWLMDALDLDPKRYLVLYIGDDETDEDAFRVLGADGVGVRVGPEVSDSLGDYQLTDPSQVQASLEWLTSRHDDCE